MVKHSSLDSLYDGLPVVILNDWTELTESRLLEEWHRISQTVFDIDRVFFSYWKNLILHQEELAKKSVPDSGANCFECAQMGTPTPERALATSTVARPT